MRAPVFWGPGQGGIKAALLAPAAWAYGAGVAVRAATAPKPWPSPVPVICAGNVTTGGSGKTPVAMAIAAHLAAMGKTPHFLIRGYGGSMQGPLRVDPACHSAANVGDEALLLAARHPTWIGADRAATARFAVADGADVLVMDDGLQNNTLRRDLGILVFDGGFGIGNGRLLPAGPLREPLAAALVHAQAAVIVGDDQTGIASRLPRGLPLLSADIVPGPEAAKLAGTRVVAFAGIGRPDKFFATLAATGADIADRIPFPDHHVYSAADMAMLTARTRQLNAKLVTTEKDWVRLDPDFRTEIFRLSIELHWRDDGALANLLAPLFDGNANAG
jgi:tetraacyldisaccharide 4'-kinase